MFSYVCLHLFPHRLHHRRLSSNIFSKCIRFDACSCARVYVFAKYRFKLVGNPGYESSRNVLGLISLNKNNLSHKNKNLHIHCKNGVLGKDTLQVKPVLRRVYIYAQSHVYKQDVFKCHVFLQDTNSQVMFLCKTLWFCKTHLLKPFLRHV